MRNLKLILAYDGSEFSGWQIQPEAATVQGTLASVIGRLTGEKVLPQGSGRTDAGVHALAQVATFATESPIPAENLAKALNAILPASIRVLEVAEAAPEFHARRSARAKTYRYRMYRGEICPPFLARYVWHYPYPLDENAMAEAAKLVVGEHDFTSFAAVDPEREKSLSHERQRRNVGAQRRNLQCPSHYRLELAARGGGIHLHGEGKRLLTSYGSEPRRNIFASGERHAEACRHKPHSGCARPFRGGSNRPGQRAIFGGSRILSVTRSFRMGECDGF